MTDNPWTDDEITVLRHLWPTHTPRDIAAQLPGRSRYAVIGKAHRLGLPEKTVPLSLRRVA